MNFTGKKNPPAIPNEGAGIDNQTELAQLKNDISQMSASMNEMLELNKAIIQQNRDLIASQKKTELNSKLTNYCTKLGLKNSNEILESEDSVENKLFKILEGATGNLENIQNALKESSVGDMSTEQLTGQFQTDKATSNKVSDPNKAMDLAQQEKPELSGAALVNYAEAKYPEAFDQGAQYQKIKNAISGIGEE